MNPYEPPKVHLNTDSRGRGYRVLGCYACVGIVWSAISVVLHYGVWMGAFLAGSVIGILHSPGKIPDAPVTFGLGCSYVAGTVASLIYGLVGTNPTDISALIDAPIERKVEGLIVGIVMSGIFALMSTLVALFAIAMANSTIRSLTGSPRPLGRGLEIDNDPKHPS